MGGGHGSVVEMLILYAPKFIPSDDLRCRYGDRYVPWNIPDTGKIKL